MSDARKIVVCSFSGYPNITKYSLHIGHIVHLVVYDNSEYPSKKILYEKFKTVDH